MIDKLLIITLVIILITNLKVFIGELKRDFEFRKMNLRLSMLLDELEKELEKELKEKIAKAKVEEKKEEPKRRRGRPKKEEEK